ncbi:MAG TPA: 50S ribosomal protein L17 [bacterium]
MRHAKRNRRFSRPSEQRKALLAGLVKNLVIHGQIRTTLTRAKEAQRLAERLISLGKEGSIHARRRAFRVLQDRTLVKRVFAELAPRFQDVEGGYTRVVRLGARRGDGAPQAVLAFSRLPEATAARPKAHAPAAEPPSGPGPQPPKDKGRESKEPAKKGLLEGLRGIWTRRKNRPGAAP